MLYMIRVPQLGHMISVIGNYSLAVNLHLPVIFLYITTLQAKKLINPVIHLSL